MGRRQHHELSRTPRWRVNTSDEPKGPRTVHRHLYLIPPRIILFSGDTATDSGKGQSKPTLSNRPRHPLRDVEMHPASDGRRPTAELKRRCAELNLRQPQQSKQTCGRWMASPRLTLNRGACRINTAGSRSDRIVQHPRNPCDGLAQSRTSRETAYDDDTAKLSRWCWRRNGRELAA